VLRGDTPCLNPEMERGSTTFKPFKVDAVGWSWCDEETTLFMLLLPPGLNRELLLLYWDLGGRFGFEE